MPHDLGQAAAYALSKIPLRAKLGFGESEPSDEAEMIGGNYLKETLKLWLA